MAIYHVEIGSAVFHTVQAWIGPGLSAVANE